LIAHKLDWDALTYDTYPDQQLIVYNAEPGTQPAQSAKAGQKNAPLTITPPPHRQSTKFEAK